MSMKKVLLLFVFLIGLAFNAVSQTPPSGGDRITLPTLSIQNADIALTIGQVNNYILAKKDGWLWPVSKIVFSKNGEHTNVDIIGIDNSWANLFDTKEESIGYFILNNRLFVVSVKDNHDVSAYFLQEEGTRVFSKPGSAIKASGKPNPIWHYKYVDGAMIVTGYEGL